MPLKISLVRRREMSPEQKLMFDREFAEAALSGRALVPTTVCLKCEKPVLVREGTLQMNEGPHRSGTAHVPLIATCENPECLQIAVTTHPHLQGARWQYGSADVTLVPTRPFNVKGLPMLLTPKQQERTRQFLGNNQ